MIQAAVLGCGIGGACAALAIAKVGARVQVYEAAARSADIGGWVTLGPAAMTALDQLEVGARVREVGFPVVSISTVDAVTGHTSSFARTEPGHRWSSTHVWRRDLLEVLRAQLDTAGIPCEYGTRPDPLALDGDLVVGADGARSDTRRLLGNFREPTYTGQLICYGHFPAPVQELPRGVLHFWTHFAGVVGYVGDDRDGSFWFSRRQAESPTTVIDPDAFVEPLRETPVAQVLQASDVSAPVALYELEPEGIWHTADTVLIGDAAHAVSPAAGRGATSAIEDGVILARALRDSRSVAAALDWYTATRRPVARATARPQPGQRAVAATAAELEL